MDYCKFPFPLPNKVCLFSYIPTYFIAYGQPGVQMAKSTGNESSLQCTGILHPCSRATVTASPSPWPVDIFLLAPKGHLESPCPICPSASGSCHSVFLLLLKQLRFPLRLGCLFSSHSVLDWSSIPLNFAWSLVFIWVLVQILSLSLEALAMTTQSTFPSPPLHLPQTARRLLTHHYLYLSYDQLCPSLPGRL